MISWTVTDKATSVSAIILTGDDQTPFDCGYDALTHDVVEMTATELEAIEVEHKRSTRDRDLCSIVEADKRLARQDSRRCHRA